MQDIIHRYLNRFYVIKTSEVGNDGIYLIDDTRKYRTPVYGDKILKELMEVFSFSEEILKVIVNIWSVSIKPDVDLEFYWKTNEEIVFPTIRRIASSVIGLDLVNVLPMSAPTGMLFVLDYQYSGNTNDDLSRQYIMGIDPIN